MKSEIYLASMKVRRTKPGQKVCIELTIEDYGRLVDDLEELDSIHTFDAAQKSGEPRIPFDQAAREIERSRK